MKEKEPRNLRKIYDMLGTKLMLSASIGICVLFFILFFFFFIKSLPIWQAHSISEILFSSIWNPDRAQFGLYAIIVDTLLVTGLALLIAVPISLLSAIYISEYAPIRLRKFFRPFIDVLAGIPSVVYGLCAFLFIVPITKDTIAPFFGIYSTGLCVFTASIILAVMVFPIIISLCVESFNAIPLSLKEASLSVGATKWETVKKVVFRASSSNILAAILLGFGRAFGETIAVAMVIGGAPRIPATLFAPGQTLAALIASGIGEIISIPLFEAAFLTAAFILFVIVLLFNILGIIVLRRARKRWSY
jgi:phosphate transport system permease protein